MRKKSSEGKTSECRTIFESAIAEACYECVSDSAWLDRVCRVYRTRHRIIVSRDARVKHVSRSFCDIELIRRDGGSTTPSAAFPERIEKYLTRAVSAHACAIK